MAVDAVARAVGALRAGGAVLLPADGVYGLCADARSEDAVRALYELKGREASQPTAVLAASIEELLDFVPELRGRAEAIARALLPGPYTLVLPNPARRHPWLNGASPEAIGVRVAELPAGTRRVLAELGAVAATSANEPGEPPAAALEAVSPRIRSACAAEIDAGTLSGEPSTVIDFTGEEAIVVREGAGPVAQALAAARLR
ncbi:MAG TPA: L-threonylcarbamoyladenylate synthase [Gaiellaceae bacterium]|nr:L-threonylcarbamoyladenylate synthase [Gaiellaceae bacterium]